ncbi:sugar ABC transporter ATP-binding protein [Amycolatopsis thermophila]|uniref:Ribose transport system ATP-binding protein n=1 Tax=Amycolatopsis thermophila TaxID=206084 RepID=A0ABU0F148_9PSEU|nr:sugar ABC transporter ATP-binding protein [Amycolatopsis thermophila]MDQ0381282.1 ribose transport system ATP-binding protein [Amycolatopsis thermophila]
MSPSETTPLLAVDGITRTFGPVRALRGVSLAVRRGEIVGLIGENGAGKSTLLNIVSGTDSQDDGTVLVRGREVSFRDYRQATRHGVFRIFQELALVPNLTVWENFYLSHEQEFSLGGVIRRGSAIRRARALLDRFDHGWIDPARPVGDYPFAVQQVIEILKAFALAELLGHEEPIILLDEPTAALASDEIEFLHRLLVEIKRDSAVVLVSHRLSELLEWSDRVVVFKDGATVADVPAADLSESELHYLMVGRERDQHFYREHRQGGPREEVVLELSGFGDGQHFHDIDLTVRAGEIVGIAGVLGSGKSELGRAVFGAVPARTGRMTYRGREMTRASAREMTKARAGYLPPERKDDGLLDTFTVAQNISFARVAAQRGPLLNLRHEQQQARHYIDTLRVKTPSPRASILHLSGGNQQKALLARWLARGVDLLILDNPTRGVDAGAKEEIYDIIRDLTADGVAVLLISDDLLEVIGLSHRVAVMKDGVLTHQVPAPPEDKPHEADLVAAMV